jgi:hypothetical protein
MYLHIIYIYGITKAIYLENRKRLIILNGGTVLCELDAIRCQRMKKGRQTKERPCSYRAGRGETTVNKL